jgi:alkylation response protein AidB-like acyl-CoA dehydrogenase
MGVDRTAHAGANELAATAADEVVSILRASIDRYTAEHYDFERRWVALKSTRAYSEQAWSDYAQFGWLAVRLPEEMGGLGLEASGIAPLMEAVGAKLLLEPILASVVIGTGLVLHRADAAQQAELLPRLADGSLKLAFAHEESPHPSADGFISSVHRDGAVYGSKIAVLHGDCADRLIVSAKDVSAGERVGLYMIEATAPRVRRQAFRLLDGRGAANLHFEGAAAIPLAAHGGAAADSEAIATVLDEASVALCSEALGAIHALNSATLGYLKARKQFGRPIGANQALQHRMVDLYMLEQEARAMTLAAQRALARPGPARTRMVGAARAFICEAGRRIAAEAVQMHGGIGVSDELDVSHYYRRLMVVGMLFGNRDYHLARFMDAAQDEGII